MSGCKKEIYIKYFTIFDQNSEQLQTTAISYNNNLITTEKMASIFDICILGAGFSGLAAARRLQQSCKNVNVCVIEARDRIGGRIHTMCIANESLDPPTTESHYTVDIGGIVVRLVETNL